MALIGLRDEEFNGFGKYQYQVIDNFPISEKVFRPIFRKLGEFIPDWLAPNLMTMLGFLFTLSQLAVLTWYRKLCENDTSFTVYLHFYGFYNSLRHDPFIKNNVSENDDCSHSNSSISKRDIIEVTTIPSWVWIYCAFAHLVAYALDNLDGIQARRLGLCSPLGEIFDHGVDVWTGHMVIMNICTAVATRPIKHTTHILITQLT